MTNPNLGRQWFHGTDAELRPGDTLSPGNDVGRSRRGDSDRLWLSDNAWHAGKYGYHVYEVEPSAEPKRRDTLSPEYHVRGHATVLRSVDTPEIIEHSNRLAPKRRPR